MAVVFTSTIKVDESGKKWFIELVDTTDEENMQAVICSDLDEYETKIEELGAEYGGHIDEVRWLKDDNVPPFVLDEIRVLMAERREKLEEEIGEPITPVTDKL
jgi:hypothetical protein